MALEDFERELAQEQSERKHRKRSRSRSPRRHDEHERKRHHNRSHHSSRHSDLKDNRHESKHRHKRSRRERDTDDDHKSRQSKHSHAGRDLDREETSHDEDEWVEKNPATAASDQTNTKSTNISRDSWMVEPSSLDVDYVQRKRKATPPPQHVKATEQPQALQVHENELNRTLKFDANSEDDADKKVEDKPAQHTVDYTFGDAGASWRMTKLKAVFDQAKQSGRRVEDIAVERYGDLRSFDDAREEEVELDRRKTYGKGYIGKEKPSGEFYQERKLENGIRRDDKSEEESSEDEFEAAQGEIMREKSPPHKTVPLDNTALNKLKAQMMRAKLKGGAEAAKLEAEYNEAMARAANEKQPDVVVLNTMENRMLEGGRKGEVQSIDNKRGRERGLVKENEDMSIDDMVRQERRSKGQRGGESHAFAERIAKDAKFTNDLDYMDENATKLSKYVQKSDINLRDTAVADYQKTKRILETCPLCHHEDTSTPPLAPLVSLGTRVYLTLPTSPEITPYGLCASIIPIQHHKNLLDCDEDEWEEIRNFMKSLSRFYYAQKPKMGVIFYENAAQQGMRRHASLEAIPLPMKHAETAPAFFREAILAADEEWTQHRKLINTLDKANNGGLGKHAFRRSMVSDLPYFHVWFSLDGGLGHVVEDDRRWPKGDLFAREIIGGMLDVGAEVIKRQGRWHKGDAEMQKRVHKFKAGWDKYDWTHVLMEPQS